MRNRIAALLEAAGAGLFLFGVYMLSVWALVAVTGAGLVVAAVKIEERP